MNFKILATGSSGNAVLLNGNILIDIGVPWKKIAPFYASIKLVLLDHEHSDHFTPSTAKTLAYYRPSIRWVCAEWMVEPLLKAGIDPKQIDIVFPLDGHALTYTGIAKEGRMARISAVPLTHNVPNIGYRIQLGDERVFYATDTGNLDGIEAKDYDLYLIEANHTQADITKRLMEKLEAGEYAYEYRAAENHLSLEQATDWLLENVGPNSEYQFLHQHREESEEDG